MLKEFVEADKTKVEKEIDENAKGNAEENLDKFFEKASNFSYKLEDLGKQLQKGIMRYRVFKAGEYADGTPKLTYVQSKYLLDKNGYELFQENPDGTGLISIRKNNQQIGIVMPLINTETNNEADFVDVPKMVKEKANTDEVMLDITKYSKGQNKLIKNFIDVHIDKIENEPAIYTGDKTIKGVLEYLGSQDNKTATVKTPIQEIILDRNNLRHLIEENEKARVQNLLTKTLKTMQNPNLIIQTNEGGTIYNYYIKAFKKDNNKVKTHLQIIKCKPDGNFYVTNYSLTNKKFTDLINNGQIIYDLSDLTASAQDGASVNDIIPNPAKNFKPKENFKTKENLVEKFILKPRIDKIILGESKWGKFYTDWIDRLTPIENLVKAAKERTSVPFAKNPYL